MNAATKFYAFRTANAFARFLFISKINTLDSPTYWIAAAVYSAAMFGCIFVETRLFRVVKDPTDAWYPQSDFFFCPFFQDQNKALAYTACSFLGLSCEYVDTRQFLKRRKGTSLWLTSRYLGIAFACASSCILVSDRSNKYPLVLYPLLGLVGILRMLAIPDARNV